MSADDGEENRFLGAESPRRGAQATRYSSAVRSFHVNVTDWMAYPELGQQALDLADIVDAKLGTCHPPEGLPRLGASRRRSTQTRWLLRRLSKGSVHRAWA